MFHLIEKVILILAGMRIFSGMLELTAGFLILKFNSVEKAMMVNAFLAIAGPIIFITSMTLGVLHLTDKLSFTKMLLIMIGVGFILLGLKK
ncbi:YqhV family protein [Bacillus shivajii]|uniref:YqhV family protein n=1 Tax=Bacillus shivajii TaxID=1983719 RepID=UPI001CF948E5|nr:YqhV family protein [Bacillus shivajii]UCZ55158.1 YqhV family protein [Bacillus shivajii]